MSEPIRFAPEAALDLTEAFHWYESRQEGLGDEFLGCVQATVVIIQQFPELFPVAVENIRHAPIRRFPYEVFYQVSGDRGVYIHAVFHGSQNPQKWQRRIGRSDHDEE